MLGAEKNFLAAVKKGDPAFLKRTFTDDYFFVGFDGEIADREETIEMLGDGGLDILPYNFKVVTEGDNMAIVTYDVVLQVPPAEDQGPPPTIRRINPTCHPERSVCIREANANAQSKDPMHFSP